MTLHDPELRLQNDVPEPPVRHIAVAGGGVAGWMTALLLSTSRFGARLKVTVLESPTPDVTGVDEGATPWLRGFFDSLGIDEAEWMPACDATYKSGTLFDGWSTRPGYERRFQPYPSMLDSLTMPPFLRNVHARLNGADVVAHPDRFFLSRQVALEGRAPRPGHAFPFELGYGYHVDTALLAAFLRARALARGVAHVTRPLVSAALDERGDIRALVLDGGDSLAADFFVDCTGPAALLIGQALKTPYLSSAAMLLNDAALAMTTPDDGGPLPSQTVATALRHGWAWRLPLASRRSHGYVYSSAHGSADVAETELRAHLGLLDADVSTRHVTMRAGRHAKHWQRNCLAVGPSQGVVEPLQGSGLLSAQRAAASFVDVLERGDLGEAAQAAFNAGLDACVDGERDFVALHYKTNTRTDTDYWRANATNDALSEPMRRLLQIWLSGQPIAPGIEKGVFGAGVATLSWYGLLAGVGLFPDVRQGVSGTGVDLAGIDNLIERSTLNFPDHRAWLRALPPHADRIHLAREPAGAGCRAALGALRPHPLP